ncbi:3-hydroxyacyl-CoA dehydrogenase PaaH [Agrobacterium tumefaciens str. B6]|uniref:3-hydroxyacyl-CoA dehydrogenase PaaH n=2 Tax=Agrobacterium TaxID=357 RepID=A0A822VCR9_AGRTU|nr:3-hydroxyacyl-CoA dehydrogenase family protein [Agrobacterium tumefaciens]NTA08352.1 3-hydroxyacyl-CoA dehydrogenase family protein [Agrobacterium tumefaciens]NTB16174.1 3-hydroxyacyl-CoA dehydrogenase family protein [Agrobacterium tumefaciens]CVI25189.1 3-hydroxyacyl-CoA dehydrogenase PaaH [Agrobacterium tumefaciens str. B6]SPZ33115.1 3-hydroxybutyryl-CoA dehydrogenase [Agrobacterium tumefaciens]
MMSDTKMKIAVIGAGLMGHGIAQVFAVAGHSVAVFDAHQPALDTLRSRIAKNLFDLGLPDGAQDLVTGYAVLADAVIDADVVIEAAPEKLELKRSIFADLVRLAPKHAILASNTSVIPITDIAQGLETGERILGTHWWNPPSLVPLVEVIGTAKTDPNIVAEMIDLLASAGKTPVHVKRDVPGFVGNRLQHALWREAIAIVAEGIADAETVDTVVKSSFGRRLAVLGPLENADLVGTDLTLDIHNVVLEHLNRDPGPSPYLRELVENGRLGMKSGEGFRAWTEEGAAALRARVAQYLRNFKPVE